MRTGAPLNHGENLPNHSWSAYVSVAFFFICSVFSGVRISWLACLLCSRTRRTLALGLPTLICPTGARPPPLKPHERDISACCGRGLLSIMVRACLNPPPKSAGTSRMEDYLPDEFVPIGCRHRTDSMQPEKKQISRKRKNMCLTPFSSSGGPNGPTERPDRTARLNGHKRRIV